MNKFSIVSDLLAQINSQLQIPEQEMDLFYPLLLSELSEGEQIYFENVGTFLSATNESGVQTLSFVPDGMTDEFRSVEINLFPEHNHASDNLLDQTLGNEVVFEALAKEFAAIIETGYRSFPVDIVDEEKVVEKIAINAVVEKATEPLVEVSKIVKPSKGVAPPQQNLLPWHLSSEWSLGVDAPISLDDEHGNAFGGISEKEISSAVSPGKKILKKEFGNPPRAVANSTDFGFTPVLLPGEINTSNVPLGISSVEDNFDPDRYDVPNASMFGSSEGTSLDDQFPQISNSFDDFAVDGVGQKDDDFGFGGNTESKLPFENSFEPDFNSTVESGAIDFDSLIMDPSIKDSDTESVSTFIAPEPEEPTEKISLPSVTAHMPSKQELRSFKIGSAFTEEPAPLIPDVGISKRSVSFSEIIAHFFGSLFKKKEKGKAGESEIPALDADKLAIDVSAKNASPIMPNSDSKTFFAPPVDDEFAKNESEKTTTPEAAASEDKSATEKEAPKSLVPLYAAAIVLVGLIGVLGYAQLFMGGVLALLHGNQQHEAEKIQVATLFRDFSFPVSAQYPPLAQQNVEQKQADKKESDKMGISEIIENEKKSREKSSNPDSVVTDANEQSQKPPLTAEKPKTAEQKKLEDLLGIKEREKSEPEKNPAPRIEKKQESKPAVKSQEKKPNQGSTEHKPTEKKPTKSKSVQKDLTQQGTNHKSSEKPEVKKTEYKKPVTGDIYESGGKYYVQHSSWASEGKATESWRELRAKGLRVIVEKTTVPEKGERYRVRSGPYGSLEEARKAEQKNK